MFDGKRIVVVTPAGRQRYMELLVKEVYKLRAVVDEYRLWVNTENEADIKYMESLQQEFPDFITLERLTVPWNRNVSIASFFKNCQDPNTVYVRFDDDIVMIDDIDAFKDFLKFRISNPEYFLVYANILNNAILCHLQQRQLVIPAIHGAYSGYLCSDPNGWNNGNFACGLHQVILDKLQSNPEKRLRQFHIGNWLLNDYVRVSINCISWIGDSWTDFSAIDEEEYLSVDYPRSINRPNVIYGGFSVVHFAYFTQRNVMDASGLLDAYKRLQ